jgi:methylated-DNA-protein-cysteine methyltransferase-like protein
MLHKSVFDQIRDLVKTIPKGKVTTYGAIARFLGLKSARVVGWALKGNQNPLIPCHRVIQKQGTLAKNFSLGGDLGQKQRLENDGIIFDKHNHIDMSQYYWQPVSK